MYGTAVAEEPDNEKEIFDYSTSKPYFVAVSEKMLKASGGKNLMPIRAMHHDGAPIAAGHAIELSFDDETKKIRVVGKITDDNEWRKCQDGTYTGFSIEGSYIKRWPDTKKIGYKRYTAKPIAVALADVPMVDGATFDLVKANGSSESLRLSGNADKPAREPRDFVDQFWGCKTLGHEHMEKDDAVDCVKKTLTGDVGHDVEVEEEAGRPHDQAVAIALSEHDKTNKAAGDGAHDQEEEMDEKDLEKITKVLTDGNEGLKKAFGAQIDDVKTSVGAQVVDVKKTLDENKKTQDARMDEIESGLEILTKAFISEMGEAEEDDEKPILKAVKRSQDVGADGEDEPEEREGKDEDEPEKLGKAQNGFIKRKGFGGAMKRALSNPIVFGAGGNR